MSGLCVSDCRALSCLPCVWCDFNPIHVVGICSSTPCPTTESTSTYPHVHHVSTTRVQHLCRDSVYCTLLSVCMYVRHYFIDKEHGIAHQSHQTVNYGMPAAGFLVWFRAHCSIFGLIPCAVLYAVPCVASCAVLQVINGQRLQEAVSIWYETCLYVLPSDVRQAPVCTSSHLKTLDISCTVCHTFIMCTIMCVLWHAVQCCMLYAVLCCAVLCCAVLCCAVLCCCCTVLCYVTAGHNSYI